MFIVHAALIAVLAQSSAGPSDGLGSSAGPVGGSINPYTATPGSLSGGSTGPGSAGLGSGGTSLGTQQEQSGSAGVVPREAASPTTSSKTTTTGHRAGPGGGAPDEIDKADQPNVGASAPGPAGLDKGTSAVSSPSRGPGLMETGNGVTTVPPPSLTNTGTAKRSSEPNAASRTSTKPSSSSAPATPATPATPPPSPTETGSSSTR
jgi:hypothetical protein